MRNLLALAAAAILMFAVVGWWLGWYQITSTPDGTGHQNIHIDVNKNKISEDLKKGKAKLYDLLSPDSDAPEHQLVMPRLEPPPAPTSPARTNPDGALVLPGVVPADYTPRAEPPPE
jgi:hypothetical protein